MPPEYPFLPNLPKASLDDRSFEDLVEECLLRIPRYCPEWTNYNPGDPGVTLLELFAWLVHQMLFRFNQVPRRHYVAFLELLGVRLLPPAPAHTVLTFYLTQATTIPTQGMVQPRTILRGTEVATVRTETQEAIIFTTDSDLTIRHPRVRHLLLAEQALGHPRTLPADQAEPEADDTVQLLINRLRPDAFADPRNEWTEFAPALELLPSCQPDNCFYLVVEAVGEDPDGPVTETLNGHVLAFTFQGPAAVTTGVNPDHPPLQWQAWDGTHWQSDILRETRDDKTKGFSFAQRQQPDPNADQEAADVILHLPQKWPRATWGDYEGHWIRCTYTTPVQQSSVERQQFEFLQSPEIRGLKVRSTGAAVSASECVQMTGELIGISNGKPGQTFQLNRRPILQRREGEHIEIRLPDGTPENWQEVPDFGDSTAQDPHYTIDNESGTVQFGPLIREPDQLRRQTQERSQVQSWGRPMRVRQSLTTPAVHEYSIPAVLEAPDRQPERQYGKVPAIGAEIYMVAYRVGGGSRGNVQAGRLTVLKSAIPYIKQVINYDEATGGREAESLEEAMIRVPALLRTRETALTPEEFECKAEQFLEGRAVFRAHCITAEHLTTPGVTRLLIIPKLPKYRQLPFDRGLAPANLNHTLETFIADLQNHLNQHRALGIRVTLEAPEYIGVKVRAQVYLLPHHSHEEERHRIATKLKTCLYRFLNPLVGGPEGQGWPRKRWVESSDIIALLQQIPEVHSVAQVQLFALKPFRHHDETGWMLMPMPLRQVELGELAIATSWEDDDLNSGHEIEFLDI